MWFFPGSAEYAIKERNRQKVWKNTLENLVNTDNTDEQVVLDADLLAFYNGRLFLKVKGESGLSFGIVFFGEGIDDPNLVRHEYGHTVQLKKIGLADYIRQVAIPSLCGYLLNETSLLPPGLYYNLPWEYTADVYGGVTWSHMDFADEISALYWFFLINIITEESYDEKQINNNVYFYLDIYVIWL